MGRKVCQWNMRGTPKSTAEYRTSEIVVQTIFLVHTYGTTLAFASTTKNPPRRNPGIAPDPQHGP
eukprot:6315515-Pyramimonas_sp.AAC.1